MEGTAYEITNSYSFYLHIVNTEEDTVEESFSNSAPFFETDPLNVTLNVGEKLKYTIPDKLDLENNLVDMSFLFGLTSTFITVVSDK